MGLYSSGQACMAETACEPMRQKRSNIKLLWLIIKKWKHVKCHLYDVVERSMYENKEQERHYDYLTEKELSSPSRQYKIEYQYHSGDSIQNQTYRAMVYERLIVKENNRPYWSVCGESTSNRSCEDARQDLVKEIAKRKEVEKKGPAYITEEDLALQKSFL